MRHVVEAAEAILDKPVKLLDYGHVSLIDYMGSDTAIVDAARTSISGQGVKKIQEDVGLIRYLTRMRHTTPLEMVVFKFHCKMPIFVARQWIRHRMSTVNEMSGRYGVLPEEYYIPELADMQFQDPKNKQGRSGGLVPETTAERIRELLRNDAKDAFLHYHAFLGQQDPAPVSEDEDKDFADNLNDAQIAELAENGGMAKELARIGLPLNIYTQWVWKIDLHNLMGFLRLRMDTHAQMEIRVFANAMAEMVRAVCPIAFEAFEDFILNAVTFSAQEVQAIKLLVHRGLDSLDTSDAVDRASFKTKREGEEFQAKLKKLLAA